MRVITLRFFEIVAVLCAAQQLCEAGDTCTAGISFGDSGRMPTQTGVFLDLAHPATGSGTAITWKFCYYDYTSAPDKLYKIIVAVFRPTQCGGRQSYLLVEDSCTQIMFPTSDYSGDFNCLDEPPSIPFTIQEGDVLGMCTDEEFYNDLLMKYVTPLNIFDVPSEPQQLHHFIPDAKCTVTNLRDAEFLSGSPSLVNGAIHLHLDIDCSTTSEQQIPSCEANVPQATSDVLHVPQATSDVLHVPQATSDVLHVPQATSDVLHETMEPFHTRTDVLLPGRPSASNTPDGSSTPKSASKGSSPELVVPFIALSSALLAAVFLGLGGCTCVMVVFCVLKRKRRAFTVCHNERGKIEGVLTNPGPDTLTLLNLGFQVAYSAVGQMAVAELLIAHMQMEGETSPYCDPAETEEALYAQFQEQRLKIIPRERIRIEEFTALGKGHFGTVYRGIWHDSREDDGMAYEVAMKSLTPNAAEGERVKLLREAAIMGQFHHPNILQLYGVVVEVDMVLLVMELANKGDLKKYLRSLAASFAEIPKSELESRLFKFSKEIAAGMVYLSQKGFIHRDLAARNILLMSDKTCKIGDFGMSRELMDNPYYYMSEEFLFPVKWTAPEAISHQKFSSASDVWSYGFVLYELWSIGEDPYPKHSTLEVLGLLQAGYSHPHPDGTPQIFLDAMTKCWQQDPHKRPTFRELLISLLTSTTPRIPHPPLQGPNRAGDDDLYYNICHI